MRNTVMYHYQQYDEAGRAVGPKSAPFQRRADCLAFARKNAPYFRAYRIGSMEPFAERMPRAKPAP